MKIKQVNLNFFYGYRCNYSCDGCFSGSDSVDQSLWDPDLNKLKQSIKRSSELFEITSMITLIGGEPFLYWDERILPLALELNSHFPDTRINITSNGQLLGKNLEKVLLLSEKINNFSITISKHLEGSKGTKIEKIWQKSIDDFISHPNIIKIHDDHYHVSGNINANIYFYGSDTWKPYYYRTPEGKIKPWKTNDPAGSLKHGCPGSVCSCIIDDKLYKCPTLATLPGHLSAIGQDQDSDWKKYLDYPAIDLNNIDPDAWNEFNQTYGKPTTYCDMCNNNPKFNIEWQERSYSMIFRKDLTR
jgi:hypothetical protein